MANRLKFGVDNGRLGVYVQTDGGLIRIDDGQILSVTPNLDGPDGLAVTRIDVVFDPDDSISFD